MLTKYDEFLCHQAATTFDHVNTSAREWTERVIAHYHDNSGKYHLSLGFGLYPNRNVIDAFACLTIEGKTQHNVRASRELRPLRDEVRVGPFSYDILEPMKKMRSRLEDNKHGLSYDIEFEGTMPCHEEDHQWRRFKGRVIEDSERYNQVGRGAGWIKYDDKTIKLDKGSCYVERDHSWGIRRAGGVPEQMVEIDIPQGGLYSWAVMQFKNWGACYHIREEWDGMQTLSSGGIFYPFGSGKPEIRTVKVEHDFKFEPDVRKMTTGKVALVAADGSKTEISMKPLNYACLKAGGYFGYRGFVHGQWFGGDWMDGFKLDLTDKAVLKDVSFLDDTSCELRCGNEVGYGVLELVVSGKYPRYGYQGY